MANETPKVEVFKTGFPGLDEALNGGIRRGQLFVMTAQPYVEHPTNMRMLSMLAAAKQNNGTVKVNLESPDKQ